MSRALWKLNELEYFEAPGVSLLVFHNRPYGRKQSGLEIIQHGERIATNGGLRLPDSARCEAHREADQARGQVSVILRYPRSEVEGVLHLHPEGRSLRVTLDLARPIPEKVAGRAAFEDLRFKPLSIEEFPGLELHLSILSPAEPIHFNSEQELLAQLQPKLDGLILRLGHHRATFLPSVWDTLPEPEQFLAHLKQKAGLAPDFWSDRMEFERYGTDSFGETESGGA